jgi:hypothetical protein
MTDSEVIAKLVSLDHQIQLLSVMVREFIHELREDSDETIDATDQMLAEVGVR